MSAQGGQRREPDIRCAIAGCGFVRHGESCFCERHWQALPAEMRESIDANYQLMRRGKAGMAGLLRQVLAANRYFATEFAGAAISSNGGTEWTE